MKKRCFSIYLSVAAELGINFSHIQAKSMTVLNPLQQVDERIMDDADLAGPLLFFFCFGMLLLLVSSTHYCFRGALNFAVGEAAVWVHLRLWATWFHFHIYFTQPHVRKGHRCLSSSVGIGILSTPHGRSRCCQCYCDTRVRLFLF